MGGHLLAVDPLIHSVSFDPEVLGYLVDREPSVFNHLTFPWRKPGGQLLPTVNNREANHEENLSNWYGQIRINANIIETFRPTGRPLLRTRS